MSARLEVAVRVPLHRFALDAAFGSDASTLGLFGDSGAGKTTILETIAGLRRGASGTIAFDGETWLDSERGVDRPPEARGVGYVPQDALLFPHWDARRNVLAGASRASRAAGAGRARLDPDHVMRVLGVQDLGGRRVGTLSGGERQRVALARALCSGPSLLLLDEPLASIEAPLRGRILPYLLRVRDEFRIPTIYVSHEATEVTVLCDEVVVVREGKIAGRGRPADVFTGAARAAPPAEVHAEDYENVLEGTVVAVEEERATVRIAEGRELILAGAAGAEAGAHVLVGVRAGEWMIALAGTEGLSARNVLPGTIRDLREVDGRVIVLVGYSEDRPAIAAIITTAALRALDLRPGMAVRLVAKAQSCRLLAVR